MFWFLHVVVPASFPLHNYHQLYLSETEEFQVEASKPTDRQLLQQGESKLTQTSPFATPA